jgi:hypothetical protein
MIYEMLFNYIHETLSYYKKAIKEDDDFIKQYYFNISNKYRIGIKILKNEIKFLEDEGEI